MESIAILITAIGSLFLCLVGIPSPSDEKEPNFFQRIDTMFANDNDEEHADKSEYEQQQTISQDANCKNDLE